MTGWWRPSGPNWLLPHADIEPVSETRARNGIFCCRDRAAKRAHSPRLQEQRPRLLGNFGRHVFEIAALLRVSQTLYNFRVWVVELTGTEPATPSMSTRCSPAELRALNLR